MTGSMAAALGDHELDGLGAGEPVGTSPRQPSGYGAAVKSSMVDVANAVSLVGSCALRFAP
jgi:hypothetical protein